jgi:hypothetical protein
MRRLTLASVLLLVASGARAEDGPLIAGYVEAAVSETPKELKLDPFYKKHADALGIAVVSSEKAPDAALLVARDIVIHMLAKRADLREQMVKRKMRVIVMAKSAAQSRSIIEES